MVSVHPNMKRKLDDTRPSGAQVRAQRKFAQGVLLNNSTEHLNNKRSPSFNSPSPPPVATKPKTEDFINFLCYRGTPALPPCLSFFNYASLRGEELKSRRINEQEAKFAMTALKLKYQEKRLSIVSTLAKKVKERRVILTRSKPPEDGLPPKPKVKERKSGESEPHGRNAPSPDIIDGVPHKETRREAAPPPPPSEPAKTKKELKEVKSKEKEVSRAKEKDVTKSKDKEVKKTKDKEVKRASEPEKPKLSKIEKTKTERTERRPAKPKFLPPPRVSTRAFRRENASPLRELPMIKKSLPKPKPPKKETPTKSTDKNSKVEKYSRPTRKTKENATIYLGLINKDFSSDDDELNDLAKSDGESSTNSSDSETKFLEKQYNASVKRDEESRMQKSRNSSRQQSSSSSSQQKEKEKPAPSKQASNNNNKKKKKDKEKEKEKDKKKEVAKKPSKPEKRVLRSHSSSTVTVTPCQAAAKRNYPKTRGSSESEILDRRLRHPGAARKSGSGQRPKYVCSSSDESSSESSSQEESEVEEEEEAEEDDEPDEAEAEVDNEEEANDSSKEDEKLKHDASDSSEVEDDLKESIKEDDDDDRSSEDDEDSEDDNEPDHKEEILLEKPATTASTETETQADVDETDEEIEEEEEDEQEAAPANKQQLNESFSDGEASKDIVVEKVSIAIQVDMDLDEEAEPAEHVRCSSSVGETVQTEPNGNGIFHHHVHVNHLNQQPQHQHQFQPQPQQQPLHSTQIPRPMPIPDLIPPPATVNDILHQQHSTMTSGTIGAPTVLTFNSMTSFSPYAISHPMLQPFGCVTEAHSSNSSLDTHIRTVAANLDIRLVRPPMAPSGSLAPFPFTTNTLPMPYGAKPMSIIPENSLPMPFFPTFRVPSYSTTTYSPISSRPFTTPLTAQYQTMQTTVHSSHIGVIPVPPPPIPVPQPPHHSSSTTTRLVHAQGQDLSLIQNLPNVSIVPRFDRNSKVVILPNRKTGPSSSQQQQQQQPCSSSSYQNSSGGMSSSSNHQDSAGSKKKGVGGRKPKQQQPSGLPAPSSPLTVRKDSITPATYSGSGSKKNNNSSYSRKK